VVKSNHWLNVLGEAIVDDIVIVLDAFGVHRQPAWKRGQRRIDD